MTRAEKIAREWVRAHEPSKEDTEQLIQRVAERTIEEACKSKYCDCKECNAYRVKIRNARWWEEEA